MKKTELTQDQRAVLAGIKNGADVYSVVTAKLLRELEKTRPELLIICKAKNPPTDAAAQQPYFGAKLTAKGRAAIKTKR